MKKEIKKGAILQYQAWPYKVVDKFGDILLVRPCNGGGTRVRMHSPTIALKYDANGVLVEYDSGLTKTTK